jgi:hypothetical protein
MRTGTSPLFSSGHGDRYLAPFFLVTAGHLSWNGLTFSLPHFPTKQKMILRYIFLFYLFYLCDLAKKLRNFNLSISRYENPIEVSKNISSKT